MQDGPFHGHVLAGRQPRRVEAGLANLALLRSTGTSVPTLARWLRSRPRPYIRPARLRPRRGARTRPTCSSGSSRTTSSPPSSCEALILTPKGRVIAPLLVWRRGGRRFPAADRARARRDRARPPDPDAHRLAVRDRARGAHLDDRARRRPTGSRSATTACRRSRCSTAISGAEPADDELERLRILARTPRWGRELDEGILPAEAGLDERAVSFTKGCYPGPGAARAPAKPRPRQPHAPRARARRRGPRARGRRGRPRRATGRARHELPSRASRLPTSESRFPRAPSSTWRAGPHGYTDCPRARSSGDRALPCGGRGRKFESCRAHDSTKPCSEAHARKSTAIRTPYPACGENQDDESGGPRESNSVRAGHLRALTSAAATSLVVAVVSFPAPGSSTTTSRAAPSSSRNPGGAQSSTTSGPAYPLKVGPTGRYLVDQRGRPFFIVGDSPQALIGNLSLQDAAAFIADRKAAGFNSLLVDLLCAKYTGCRPDGTTIDGIKPFTTQEISRPRTPPISRGPMRS